ncbi:MAG: hypothetical protein JWM11_4883 [Planctomycetaceae bacterium]|nr:hypothetical protein [Planctomycetaceae bacterium]
MANPEHERILRDSARNRDYSVDMSGYDLSGMLCASIRLRGLKLSGADLSGADFSGGQFCDCDFRNAILNKTRIVLGDFRNANFSGADLTASNLNGSVMTGVHFTNANLSRANLVKTRLDGADLTGANLNEADLRGAQGLTATQVAMALNNEKAIFDTRMLAVLCRTADPSTARHGRQLRKSEDRNQAKMEFGPLKPCLGDLFLLCGSQHPAFPPTGNFGLNQLADLNFEQVDDYFAICVDGDPVIWLFPTIGECIVQHHAGPFDGLVIELGDRAYRKLWSTCVARFKEVLKVPD